MMHRSLMIALLAAVFGAGVATSPLADEVEEVDGLPAYYEFFMKEGGQVRIEAERERDERIASGDVAPVSMNVPLRDFRLPDGFGHEVGLRDFVGKKNLVLTTFRTWW